MVVFINQLQSLFSRDNKLHNSRFAKLSEMLALYGAAEDHETSLLLGVGHMNHMIRVRPKPARPELGNLLVVAPTRGGKGLLAVSQLLSWRHSVVVNDIKGDLFTQTAGYRSTLRLVHRQYPAARFDVDERGISLSASPPPVSSRLVTRNSI